MKAKICILTYGKLSEMLKNEVIPFSEQSEITICEVLLNEDSDVSTIIPEADIYVSSGYNAFILQSHITKPIITIQETVADIMLCLKKSMVFGSKPLILTFDAPNAILNDLEDMFSFEYYVDSYKSPAELESIIDTYIEKGVNSVIGTALACEAADRKGLHSIYLHPHESVTYYLQLAVETAISLNAEANKNRQFSEIINHSESGLILTNTNFQVMLCNPVASNLLGLSKEKISGMKITDIFPTIDVQGLSKLRSNSMNNILATNETSFLVNFIPIIIQDSMSSLLVSFNTVSYYKHAGTHIEEVTLQKGFVAKCRFEDYKTSSPIFENTLSLARKFSQMEDIISIYGETGSGKEVIAQSIHNNSKRFRAPFVPINCSALSENLLESELFGYDEGAFTGAKKGGKEGMFEMARKGTIFLDEIGDINMAIQTKLLRVIQEKQIMRVGGNRLIPIDVRIITATNKNLWKLVKDGLFREDLYYRINVLELNIPPLRDRSEDILALFFSFLKKREYEIYMLLKSHSSRLSSILASYSWPGNVRELENFALLFCATVDPGIDSKQMLKTIETLINTKKEKEFDNTDLSSHTALKVPFPSTLSHEYIRYLEAMDVNNWNHTKAAESLGISRVTLWRRLKYLGIEG